MSDASEVKRFIHWFGPDYDGSAQFSQEVVLASDFDRIVADLRIKIRSLNLEIETRAKPTVEKLKNEITNLKAEVEVLKNHRAEYEADCKRIEYFDDLHDKAARQARVIEKLKASLEWYANATEFEISGDEVGEPLADGVPFTTVAKSILKEIEQGEGM